MKQSPDALGLSVALGFYMHTEPLFGGGVSCEGVELNRLDLGPSELFQRAIETQDFEVCEMSLSSHIMGSSQGDWPFRAIPVFPSRTFRHSLFFVNVDAGVARPEDLRGKRIGVPEYHMTAALFSRGMLWDDYGVSASDVTWVQAGMWAPGRKERMALNLPNNISLVVEEDKCLEDMLLAGEIDALTGPHIPKCFSTQADSPVRRLFADPEDAELDWYARTNLFPIMHLIVIRKDIIDAHPWVAASLVRGFEEAKGVALDRLQREGLSAVPLPFLKYEVMRTRERFGADPWPYGISANRQVLDTACRYAFEQGLASRLVATDDLFCSGLGGSP